MFCIGSHSLIPQLKVKSDTQHPIVVQSSCWLRPSNDYSPVP